MCGIAGVFHYRQPERPVDRAELARMTRALAHRGPDGEGFHVDGPVGLGHRRLAIVDLSPTGAQPMANEDGSRWITYNGEFYDHAAHRAALAARHVFHGPSDTETLVHLLEERGPAALAGVSGIFAFAFWDGSAQTLTLARDALGVKQVYFHDDGARVVFASEIKALLEAAGVPRTLDVEAVNQYLHFHTPLFERTFFRGIRQVRPGEWITWGRGAGPRSGRYWQLTEFEDDAPSVDAHGEALASVLSRTVAAQLMSDVPVGAFFSGGIDSTAVASFAARAGKPPPCFGLHFEGQGVIDERPYQERAARALGLELHLTTLDGSTFADDLARLVRQQDQPTIGAAMLPMFHVSKLAASRVKVCLGGQAADEIFGGYARYALAHPVRSAAALVTSSAPAAGAPGPAAQPKVGGNLRRQLLEARTLRRVASIASHLGTWRELYFANFVKVPARAWAEIFADGEILSRENAWLTFREVVDRSPARDRGTKLLHWDLQTYLPGLFHQDDRMSMAVSLESRVPFADPRVVEAAFRIPFDLKLRSGASKWLLRRAVADVLPDEVLNRRKVGFDTPVERWMSGQHAPFVRDVLLSQRARERGLWDPAALEGWLDDPGRPYWPDVVWKVLNIELWARAFLDGAP
jgi:asparagine synthase (glutamine-hydrolysing)